MPSLYLKDGDDLRLQRAPWSDTGRSCKDAPISRGLVSGRAFLDKAPIHLHDLLVR